MIKNFTLIRKDEESDENSTPLLFADMKRKVVITNCGDFYYDYEISFEDFIRFAKFLEGNL